MFACYETGFGFGFVFLVWVCGCWVLVLLFVCFDGCFGLFFVICRNGYFVFLLFVVVFVRCLFGICLLRCFGLGLFSLVCILW